MILMGNAKTANVGEKPAAERPAFVIGLRNGGIISAAVVGGIVAADGVARGDVGTIAAGITSSGVWAAITMVVLRKGADPVETDAKEAQAGAEAIG